MAPSCVSCHRRRGEIPRALAASRGRKAMGSIGGVAIIKRSNRSHAAKRGLHTRSLRRLGNACCETTMARQMSGRIRQQYSAINRAEKFWGDNGPTNVRPFVASCTGPPRRAVLGNPRDRKTGGNSAWDCSLRSSSRHPGLFAYAPIVGRMLSFAKGECQALRQVSRCLRTRTRILGLVLRLIRLARIASVAGQIVGY